VEAVARQYADLEFLPWEFACDALVVGLGKRDGRPQIFIRGNYQGRRRRRFTIAHEVGHVLLPWHVGLAACTPVSHTYGDDAVGPSAGVLLSLVRINEQEDEASRFAGELLVPRRYIEKAAASNDLGGVIAALEVADASAQATIHTLTRHLLPGFAFLIDEESGDQYLYSTSGTSIPHRTGKPVEAQLRDRAYAHGEQTLSGRRVSWFRLVSQRPFALPDDQRSTSDLLRSAITRAGIPAADHNRTFMRVNGIVGGMLSKDERAQAPEQALAILEHKFGDNTEFTDLYADSDFRLYLLRKAHDRVTPPK
jgi:hypothetical protein